MSTESELPKYSTIVNPTDGSPASTLATCHAIYLAKLSGARLIPVFVVDEAMVRRASVNIRRVMDDMRLKGQEVLDSVRALGEQQNVAVEPLYVEGQTGHSIVEAAAQNEADLIVMGSTAFSDLARLTARPISISEEVLKRSSCPVLIIRG
jgi:nucleotide-binding universal stress UspA family protein